MSDFGSMRRAAAPMTDTNEVPLEVRPTVSMGLGVFATRDIPAGTAWEVPDARQYACPSATRPGYEFVLTLDLSQYCAPRRGAGVACTPAGRGLTPAQSRSLGARLGGRRTCVLNFNEECLFMRINDGVHDASRTSTSYQPSRGDKSNAIFLFAVHAISLYCITTRDLCAGDEVFVAYGATYWDTVQPGLRPEGGCALAVGAHTGT
jgi:hypothetical protein